MPAGRLGALVVLGALSLPLACRSSDPVPAVRDGHALAETSSDSLLGVVLPPGQEVIGLASGLSNASAEPLEITKLRPTEASGVPDAAQIVRTALVDPDSIAASSGMYVTFPPVTRRDGSCVRTKVFPARGATLQPKQSALILVWVRAVAPGRASIPTFTVTYEQDEEVFRQTVRIDGAANYVVRADADPLKASRDERACAADVQLLPGAVRI